jgi:Phage integrase, N-terminal SAM-like domain
MSTEKREVLGENLCRAPKLLDRVRGKLRVKHYSIRTEEGYVNWITRFILFHNKRHPQDMGQRSGHSGCRWC